MDTEPNPQAANATDSPPPAGDQVSVAQLAQGMALKRRRERTPAAAEPDPQLNRTQDTGPQAAEPDDQSPPASPTADHNALWQADEPEPDGTNPAPDGTEPDPEPEPDPAAADDADPESADPADDANADPNQPPGVRKLRKRVDKLTAALRQTQEALAKANDALAQTATTAEPAAVAGSWMAQRPEVRQMDAELQVLNEHLEWVRNNEAGGEYTDKKTNESQYFDADQVRRIRDGVELRRAEVVAERAATMAALKQEDAKLRAQYEAQFQQAYSRLERDANSPEAQEFRTILKQYPQIKQFPNYKLVVGDMIRGRLAREAIQARIAQPAARSRASGREPAPAAVRPVARATITDPAQRKLRQAQQAYQQGRSVDDLARVIAAERAAARAR